jgi:succinylglutamic semialdehyde dehydrogenase
MNEVIKHRSKGHYIQGNWVPGTGIPLTSMNPVNAETIWQGHEATQDEIIFAYEAAHAAQPQWAALGFADRVKFLKSFAQCVERKRQELIQQISLETGKPLWEANTEVNSIVAKIDISIKAYLERTLEKETIVADGISRLSYKPHGVAAVIGPFNFPAHLSNGHIIPALLAGNTVLYKPSELTPAVAELILQCWHESQLPPGVINCLQGGPTTARFLLQQPIHAVFFTGSYKTGVEIHRQFSVKPEVLLALEMGGNNPLIIDEVDKIEAAVYLTTLSTLLTAGQRCTCARRILIPDSPFGDKFLAGLMKLYQTLKVGPFTLQPEPFMGPVIRPQHALQHLQTQKKLLQMGGSSLLPMALLKENSGLLSPGIVDMTEVSSPPDDEIFAPLTQIYRYTNFDQAITLANNTKYGLAAGLVSPNKQHFFQFYHSIRAGIISWNKPTTGAASNLPFGGVGHSGNHRPSAYFAADHCAYPIAHQEQSEPTLPLKLLPGISL